jgi:hypothetical protein
VIREAVSLARGVRRHPLMHYGARLASGGAVIWLRLVSSTSYDPSIRTSLGFFRIKAHHLSDY